MTIPQDNTPRIISDGDHTSRLLTLIGQHPYGSPLLDHAAAQRLIVKQEKLKGLRGEYWSGTNVINYHPSYELSNVMTLIHELRHALQDSTLRFAKASRLSPLDQIIFNRAIEADAFAFSAAVAADMVNQGMLKGAIVDDGFDTLPPGLLSRVFSGFARRADKQGMAATYDHVFKAFLGSATARKYDQTCRKGMSSLDWNSAPLFDLRTAFRDTTTLPLPGGGDIAFNRLSARADRSMTAEYKKTISAKP